MDLLRWQVARGAGVALRLQSLLRFAGLPLVDKIITTSAFARLQLLAAPALVRPDRTIVPLERKDAALLALLAFDGPTSRSRAAALLWPDADADKARNSLRQRLFRLRRAAGVELIEPDERLRLADGVEHNLGSPAQQLAGDPTAAAGDLLGVCAYEDCPELDDWVRIAREHWRAMRRDALAELAAKREADGHIAQALVYAERLLAEDPVSEQAHRLAMRLHYRRGDRAAALAAYDRCRSALRRELAAQPSTETLALSELILRADPLPGAGTRTLRSTAILRPPRLIGRDAEWRTLERSWNADLPVLISGDAGVGKSRLLGDFAQARSVPMVGGRPGDTRVPYAVLARVLRAALHGQDNGSAIALDRGLDDFVKSELARVLPELGTAPVGPLVETRFRSAVVQALIARQVAGLAGVAIDDLHFADEATLELLPQIVIPHLRWLGAVRGAECPPQIAAWLRAEGGLRLVEIPLAPLGESAVRELLESLAVPGIDADALAGAIARHTGGNPFFVLETLNAVIDSGDVDPTFKRLPTPTSVGVLIERRLGQLSPPALKLARVAALAGVDFSAGLAVHVLHTHPLDLAETWSELEVAQVIRGQTFAHDLIYETALRSVPRPIAELLQQSIAEYLESHGAPAANLAQHWAEAGQWGRAAHAHLLAAGQARRASRRVSEVEQWEAAFACFDRAGDSASAFDARCASIESLILVRGERANTVIDALLAQARSDDQRVAALTARATAALTAVDHVAGIAAAREAFALAERLNSQWPRFEAARLLAVGLAQAGRTGEALAVIEPFETLVESDGTDEQREHFWSDYAYVLNSARKLGRTAAALARAIDNARVIGDLAELATMTSNLATVQGNLGNVGQALEHALRARSLQSEIGDTGSPARGVIEQHCALYSAAVGRYGEALEAFDTALECFIRDGQTLWIAVANNNKAMMLIDLAQYGRARKALDYVEPSVGYVRARRAMLAARIARLLGGSAKPDLRRASEALGSTGDPYVGSLVELQEALEMAPIDAAACCVRVRAAAEQIEYFGVALKAGLSSARFLLEASQPDAAAACWTELQPVLASLQPADMYLPEAWLIGHNVLAANGDASGAAALLARAIEWIEQTALPNVPPMYRDSFLNRNPINRAIRTTASRRPNH
ncbi:MAG: BTAD domain-containing putative transcriptional regulator [Burkholderiaceae bacterium]